MAVRLTGAQSYIHSLAMKCEWDPANAKANAVKHRVDFADAVAALSDDSAVTIPDPDSEDKGRAPTIRGRPMWKEYDFRKGKRGPVVSTPLGKTRTTIRLDQDVVDWFKGQVELQVIQRIRRRNKRLITSSE